MDKVKGFFAEFKEFISRGNVIDLAVGVIIGGAFTSIVNSLVKDVIMPFIGWIFGGIDFTSLKYVITPGTEEIPEAAIYYGNFIQNVVNFLLVAFTIFCMVRLINKFRRKKEEAPKAPPAPSKEEVLLTEIRDLLKEMK
ncbi:MAG: large-conductance mechanosensitive channel protein MscL [Oscillospiraceae bacterium]|nr:large-conductance mechanosensitive channel protein MscL [Oscillospiraceae bacterium]MBQ9108464.1 large-conductance mechanosensitive channel protein MscL [Oscillospiraceae bacterium]